MRFTSFSVFGEYRLLTGIVWCGRYIFSIMFSPTIMLLIGGFTIASALSKTNIDRILITRVLSFAGTKPRTVLLAVMGVACFASMWIRFVFFHTVVGVFCDTIRTDILPCFLVMLLHRRSVLLLLR